jgi:hypothetical protein
MSAASRTRISEAGSSSVRSKDTVFYVGQCLQHWRVSFGHGLTLSVFLSAASRSALGRRRWPAAPQT